MDDHQAEGLKVGDLPILGRSPAMRRVTYLARKVAATDSAVLITGETGTGKELLARTIHALSERRNRPFVAVNTGAIPENLQESELFGHSRGAFTGAVAERRGLFEEANQGTLFLDEIGETSLALQVKLLRTLENKEIRAVGSNEERKVDVRIIAATNRDLAGLVRDGRFREDLFFRLNVLHIHLPPLRDRGDDIKLLLSAYLDRYSKRFNKDVKGFSQEALGLLLQYEYPGNIRELDNTVQHAVVMAEHEWIQASDLPPMVPSRLALPAGDRDWKPWVSDAEGSFGRSGGYQASQPVVLEESSFLTIAEMEKRLIQLTLEKLKGNQSVAAKKLGISRSTLWRKIKELQIKPPRATS
jgi:transcriptional regulator with PAS, ATPase and Fis domain